MIIPIQQKKEGVLDKAYELRDRLKGFKVKVDDSDKSPGWKFSEQEMRGIPPVSYTHQDVYKRQVPDQVDQQKCI